jgi:hypothetical protein
MNRWNLRNPKSKCNLKYKGAKKRGSETNYYKSKEKLNKEKLPGSSLGSEKT